MGVIYKPKGRAGEYAEYAINIYTGCNHGCFYCYARKNFQRWHPNENFADVKPREGIVEAVKEQLASGKLKGKTIELCFTCDPYPAEIDTTPTREVIAAIKEAGAHVQILTKGGARAERDFDLLDSGDWLGITYAGYLNLFSVPKSEPYASTPNERLRALYTAKKKGINTWASCEPVLDANDVLELIECADYIDLFKIGKLNYHSSDIDWKKFGRRAEATCKRADRNYYIKADLRAEMER